MQTEDKKKLTDMTLRAHSFTEMVANLRDLVGLSEPEFVMHCLVSADSARETWPNLYEQLDKVVSGARQKCREEDARKKAVAEAEELLEGKDADNH